MSVPVTPFRSKLPTLTASTLGRAAPVQLPPAEREVLASLGAVAARIDGVLWIAFPNATLAADPRANLLPVHVPAILVSSAA